MKKKTLDVLLREAAGIAKEVGRKTFSDKDAVRLPPGMSEVKIDWAAAVRRKGALAEPGWVEFAKHPRKLPDANWETLQMYEGLVWLVGELCVNNDKLIEAVCERAKKVRQ